MKVHLTKRKTKFQINHFVQLNVMYMLHLHIFFRENKNLIKQMP
jgi:hypothetical protein